MLDEYTAVHAALSAGSLAGKVYDTARLDSTGHLVRAAYAVLFGGSPAATADPRFSRVQQPGDGWKYPYTVRGIAPDPGGVRLVISTAITNLIGRQLTVAGRFVTPVGFESATEILDDDSVTPPMFFGDLEVNLSSFPA